MKSYTFFLLATIFFFIAFILNIIADEPIITLAIVQVMAIVANALAAFASYITNKKR